MGFARTGNSLKVSFTPGFSPVKALRTVRNRFNGFSFCKPDGKPLKRFLKYPSHPGTGLKAGVNERSQA